MYIKKSYIESGINIFSLFKIFQGDRRHYKRKDVTVALLGTTRADERLLRAPLILAERCWAHAMQLRQESNTEPRKRFHLVGKLRKACVYALQLQELCNVSITEITEPLV